MLCLHTWETCFHTLFLQYSTGEKKKKIVFLNYVYLCVFMCRYVGVSAGQVPLETRRGRPVWSYTLL